MSTLALTAYFVATTPRKMSMVNSHCEAKGRGNLSLQAKRSNLISQADGGDCFGSFPDPRNDLKKILPAMTERGSLIVTE